MTCLRCAGRLYLDDDWGMGHGDAGQAPALVCRNCGYRRELNAKGEPLVIQQPTRQGHPLEQAIKVMSAQGISRKRIARSLQCDYQMVVAVLNSEIPAGQSQNLS